MVPTFNLSAASIALLLLSFYFGFTFSRNSIPLIDSSLSNLVPALLPRQASTTSAPNVGSIPQTCAQYCSPVDAAMQNKCTTSQCCNNDFARNYYNCFLCVGKDNNQTDWSSTQQTYDGYVQQCAVGGMTVPHYVLTNQSSTTSSATPTLAPTALDGGSSSLDNNSARAVATINIHLSLTSVFIAAMVSWHLV